MRVTQEDVHRWLDDRQEETQTLEFKRQFYGRKDSDNRELLKNVTAMANASGGTIVIGVEEEAHRAAGVANVPDAISELERARQIVRDSVSEPIYGLDAYPLTFSSGVELAVIYVPDSLRKPHMFVHDKHQYFHRRIGTDNPPMNIHDIRQAVLEVEDVHRSYQHAWQQALHEATERASVAPALLLSATLLPVGLTSTTTMAVVVVGRGGAIAACGVSCRRRWRASAGSAIGLRQRTDRTVAAAGQRRATSVPGPGSASP